MLSVDECVQSVRSLCRWITISDSHVSTENPLKIKDQALGYQGLFNH